jgi:hypothetical protein
MISLDKARIGDTAQIIGFSEPVGEVIRTAYEHPWWGTCVDVTYTEDEHVFVQPCFANTLKVVK